MIAPVSTACETVAATLTPSAAAGTLWQAVVVGAGPAGAATAWRLATRGVRVLLIDRQAFPRGKVCGCCLSTQAIHELHDLGADALPEAALPLRAVRLTHRGRSVRLPLPAGRVISRESLDAHLVRRAIAAGCEWLPGMDVSAVHDPGGGSSTPIELRVARGPSTVGRVDAIRCLGVILAGGLAEHVRISGGSAVAGRAGRDVDPASRIGVGCVLPAESFGLPAGELVMAVGRHGYCGMVRLEDGRLDLAAALDRTTLLAHGGPARAVAALVDEALDPAACAGPAADILLESSFRATAALTRHGPLVVGASRRILRIGDGAGYVEPFTGEGIGWALLSARILTTAILSENGLRAPDEAASRYAAAHRRSLVPRHARCRLVAKVLRRPAIVAATVATARVIPWAAERIVPVVTGAGWPGGGA